MRFTFVSCFVFLLTPIAANAQCGNVVREDILQECLAAELSSADKELNATYSKLRSPLGKDEKELLTKAQKLWVSLRDTDCEFEAKSHKGGTGAQSVYLQCQIDRTKYRTTELKRSFFWPKK